MTVQISRQQVPEARQLAQIAYEDEKGHKSAQKPVIGVTEILGPRQGRDDHDQGQGQAVIEDMSYSEDGQENIPPKVQSRREGANTGRFRVRRAASRTEMGIGVPGKRNRDSASNRKDTRV